MTNDNIKKVAGLILFCTLYVNSAFASHDKGPRKHDTLDYSRVCFSEMKFPKYPKYEIGHLNVARSRNLKGKVDLAELQSADFSKADVERVRKFVLAPYMTPESINLDTSFPRDKIVNIEYKVKDVDGNKVCLYKLPENAKFDILDLTNINLHKFNLPMGFRANYLYIDDVRNCPKTWDFIGIKNVFITRQDISDFNILNFPSESFVVSGCQLPRIVDLSRATCDVDLAYNGWAFVKKVILAPHMTPESVGVPDFFDKNNVVYAENWKVLNTVNQKTR